MQPYARYPDHVWVGHLDGPGCLSALALDTQFPTVVWRGCFGLRFGAIPLLLNENGGVVARGRVLAFVQPILAEPAACVFGCGFCFDPAILGMALVMCVFGYGLCPNPASRG